MSGKENGIFVFFFFFCLPVLLLFETILALKCPGLWFGSILRCTAQATGMLEEMLSCEPFTKSCLLTLRFQFIFFL